MEQGDTPRVHGILPDASRASTPGFRSGKAAEELSWIWGVLSFSHSVLLGWYIVHACILNWNDRRGSRSYSLGVLSVGYSVLLGLL